MKFFKVKSDLPPGMSAPESQQQKPPGDSDTAGLSKAAKRNMKRKEKRKQQQEDGDVDSVSDAVENVSISEDADEKTPTSKSNLPNPPDDSSASAAERAKKLKNLKKKLRQAEDLQQKVDSGEIDEVTKDQMEKLSRVETLRDEVLQLERES